MLLCSDEHANFNIKQGVMLSRSHVHYFKHNDISDLENILLKLAVQNKAKTLHRQFIVVEGLYSNIGDICHLKQIVVLAKKFCYRIILDDTMALGVLGATGRGTPEHFNISMSDIDIFCANIDAAIASCGGFCAGIHEVCNHQRLSGAGYCFSASAPPYISTAAIVAFDLIDEHPEKITQLRNNAKLARLILQALPNVTLVGDSESPLIHLQLHNAFKAYEFSILELMRENMITKHGIAVSLPHSIPQEKIPTRPSLLVLVTSLHLQTDFESLFLALQSECSLLNPITPFSYLS